MFCQFHKELLKEGKWDEWQHVGFEEELDLRSVTTHNFNRTCPEEHVIGQVYKYQGHGMTRLERANCQLLKGAR